MSNSLRPHGVQQAKLPCSLLSPRVGSNSWPLSQWCYLNIYLIPSHPFLLLPAIFPSIRFFSNESVLQIRCPKYWRFSFSIFLLNIQGWFPFRTYWFDHFTVQGTLKSLLQQHSSKASIVWHSAFFMVQLSHPYMTTGKPIVLTICITPSSNNTREDSTHGHPQMINTKIRLIVFFAAKNGEAVYSQQKQDQELTVAQIMNSLLSNSDLIWRK